MTLGHSLEMWGGLEIGTLSVTQSVGDDGAIPHRDGKGKQSQDSEAD